MLAMDGHPFAGHHGGGEPRPEAEEMRNDRVEIHAPMCLAAVQVQGHGKNRELRDHQEIKNQYRPGSLGDSACKEIDNQIKHSATLD